MKATLNISLSFSSEESGKVNISINSDTDNNKWMFTDMDTFVKGCSPNDIEMLWSEIRHIADDGLIHFLENMHSKD